MPKKLPVTNLKESSIRILSGVSLFTGLTPADYRVALETSEVLRYDDNEVIFSQGDPCDGLYVILAGAVSISTTKDGRINRVKAGGVIGELGLLCHALRTATATSGGAGVILLRVKQTHLNELFKIEPKIYAMIMRNVAETLAQKVIELTPNDD